VLVFGSEGVGSLRQMGSRGELCSGRVGI
jgi:hypothetical protein